MHIPSSMLHGAICPVTAAVSAVGIIGASYLAYRSSEKPTVVGFSGVTALIFAVQMLNYPVANGSTGHLLGGVVASSILGIPFAILSMVLVLATQSFLFADGGINTLGVNIFNMGLVGVGLGGGILYILRKKHLNQITALAVASWCSVVLAALACSFELGVSKTINFKDVLPAMLSVHALIGVGEASGAVALSLVLARGYATKSVILALLAAFFSPLASQLPDGLTRIAQQMSFSVFQGLSYHPLMEGYSMAAIGSGDFSKIAVALTGVCLVFVLALIIGKTFKQISFNFNRRGYARC